VGDWDSSWVIGKLEILKVLEA